MNIQQEALRCAHVLPWGLWDSLLMLWNSEAAITTRLSVQVSVFHKISIILRKMWHGVGGWRGWRRYKRVKSTQSVRCQTITSPWFVSFTRREMFCSEAHPGLRFLLKASASTSHCSLNSCQQLAQNTVIHQTSPLSGVTPNKKLYIGNLSWRIHLQTCEGINQRLDVISWNHQLGEELSINQWALLLVSQILSREDLMLFSDLHDS